MSTDLATHDTMAAALQERGILTADQVAQSRAALEAQINGTGPAETAAGPNPATPQALTDQSPVTPSVDGSLDAAVFAAPQSAGSYQFPSDPPPEGVELSLDFEAANRAAMHAAGIPVSIGNELARRWNAAQSADAPTPESLAQSRQTAMAALDKAWGSERDANIALARQVVEAMAEKQPGIKDMLEVTGLGNDPWIIQTFANLARARSGNR